MEEDDNILLFKLPDKELNFQDFGKAVMEKDLLIATRVLRDIFKIHYKAAEASASFVIEQSKHKPNVLMEIINIRYLIQDDKKNDALLKVQEIFNLSGLDSVKAYEGMHNVLMKNKMGQKQKP
jgi:hypothetical protein